MNLNVYKIRYHKVFYNELYEIYWYIYYKLGNPIAVYNAIENRSYFPKSFQKFKSKNLYEWYRIYIGNFTIFYVVENNKMIVVHIIYGARDIYNLI